MAVSINKRISKGKKGGKKKIVDPFSKKKWYDIKVPNTFNQRSLGKTLVTRAQGTKVRAVNCLLLFFLLCPSCVTFLTMTCSWLYWAYKRSSIEKCMGLFEKNVNDKPQGAGFYSVCVHGVRLSRHCLLPSPGSAKKRAQGRRVMWKCVLCWQNASDGLKGRVFEVSLADLQQDEDQAFRKIKLRAEDVQGKNVLTNFWVCFSRTALV